MVRRIVLQLSLYPGIGPVLIAQLSRDGGFERLIELVALSVSEIGERYGLSERQALMVHTALSRDDIAAHDAWCTHNKVRVVLLGDADYPELLRHIGAPPVVLWVKGTLPPPGSRFCAIVGSREANHYGQRVVHSLVKALVSQDIVTVSGGARGIDGWVHEQTIAAGGKTIVVVGSGLAHTYPAEHGPLFEKIIAAGGAVISPFPPLVEPSKSSFPARNRVIAGLAPVCVVVQAAERSGALITAQQALEENREVAAVPGHIDDPVSAGCNRLIASGAHIVTSVATVLELCGGEARTAGSHVSKNVENIHESVLLGFLEQPKTLDDLLELYSGTPVELQEHLFALQIGGKIRKNHAGMWVRCG